MLVSNWLAASIDKAWIADARGVGPAAELQRESAEGAALVSNFVTATVAYDDHVEARSADPTTPDRVAELRAQKSKARRLLDEFNHRAYGYPLTPDPDERGNENRVA